MKLIEVFNQLAIGELSQLKFGKTGAIEEDNYPALIRHINLGLTDLHKRFFLKEGRLTLALQPNQTRYPLTSKYAVSNTRSAEPVKYLLDSNLPFADDIHKIEWVKTADGVALGLNDHHDDLSVTTPAYAVLQVPAAFVTAGADLPDYLKTDTLLLGYRANHPIIDPDTFSPEAVEVELPYSHLQALLYFVASRVHNPIGMANEFHSGNSYMAKYEAECMRLEQQNLAIDQGVTNSRFAMAGFA